MQVSGSIQFHICREKQVLMCLMKDTTNTFHLLKLDDSEKHYWELILFLFLLQLWGEEHSVFRL